MEDEFVTFNSGKKSTWVTVKRNRDKGVHFVYILECKEGKFYCGMTKNVILRLVAHASGNGNSFTLKYTPLKLIHLEMLPSYVDAINKETEIFRIIRKGETLPREIMKEYQNIYIIIQELLFTHNKKWVINKLLNIL